MPIRKHLFDLYAARTGLDQQICGLKYFNVFGPNEDHKGEMRSVVQKAFEQIREVGQRAALQELPAASTATASSSGTSSTSKMPSK